MKKFFVGQVVRFSPDFLANVAAPELKKRLGMITEDLGAVRPGGPHYVKVLWADRVDPVGVLTCNLAPAKK